METKDRGESASTDTKREFLRHTLATLAYRGRKAVVGASPDFGTYRVSPGSRNPVEILAHIGDLLDWALCLTGGRHIWKDSAPQAWDAEVSRFFDALRVLDDALNSPEPLGFSAEKLFQGPVADALTHVGQITMLRRLSGSPVKGENYFKADIAAGRVTAEQPPPVSEFD